VFYNLIDNAIKYTPQGGKVRVEVARAGKKAVIRVIDNGIGIPKADQLHVFDRFYRVDKARSREQGGAGLGLAIVKQVAEAHGGQVRVRSTPHEGTTFTVALPAKSEG
jgi:signal transduction histidine kinase